MSPVAVPVIVTPAETSPVDITPDTTTAAPEEDVPVVTDPIVYNYVPVFTSPDTSVDFISVSSDEDDDVDMTVETTTSASGSDAAPVLVVGGFNSESEDDTVTIPDNLYSFEENDTPLGDFYDFDQNKTPLGGFEDVDSSVKNPNTGVASPVAMGVAAIASLALAIGSRKKRK